MFWTIFWPVFAALVCAFVVSELVHIGVGFYVHKKQEKLREEFEAKVASGEIDPMSDDVRCWRWRSRNDGSSSWFSHSKR